MYVVGFLWHAQRDFNCRVQKHFSSVCLCALLYVWIVCFCLPWKLRNVFFFLLSVCLICFLSTYIQHNYSWRNAALLSLECSSSSTPLFLHACTNVLWMSPLLFRGPTLIDSLVLGDQRSKATLTVRDLRPSLFNPTMQTVKLPARMAGFP